MEQQNSWWEKHLKLKSDDIVDIIEKSPEQFLISRTEILQLVIDFKVLKRKLHNTFIMLETEENLFDAYRALSEEERRAKDLKDKEEHLIIRKLLIDAGFSDN